jgi:Zn finger protein HypA/HybF involved in hydrogenase expression
MREMMVAESILQAASGQVPAGAKLRKVKVRAGAKRGLDPQAMQVAWSVWASGCASAAVELELNTLPWAFHCPKCHAEWTSHDADATCGCGHTRPIPTGSNELKVTGIEVADHQDMKRRLRANLSCDRRRQ